MNGEVGLFGVPMRLRLAQVLLTSLAVLAVVRGEAFGQTVASQWIDHQYAKSRLVAAQHDGKLVAFVEIAMAEGWKTYWRNPGDAGGLPPSFDFKSSDNVQAAKVLYPAPKRLVDRAGETIGYKGTALFPVEVEAGAPDQAVTLRLKAHFGVCREICVPLEADHELQVPTGVIGKVEGELAHALAAVPRPASGAANGLPVVVHAEAVADEPGTIAITADFPGGAADGDIFIEAPDGLYVPMPKRGDANGDKVTFKSTFSLPQELKQILGKPLKVTLAGKDVASEAVVTIK